MTNIISILIVPLLALLVYLIIDHEFIPDPPMKPLVPMDPNIAEANAVYDMKPPSGPVLKGPLVKAFAVLLRTPIIGKLISTHLQQDNGFEEMIDFVNRIEPQVPLFLPYKIPSKEEIERHESINKKEAGSNKTSSSLIPDWITHSRVAKLHKAFLSGKLDVVENLKQTIEKIEKSDSDSDIPLRAFVFLNKEGALKAAKASAERYKQGKPLSILDGIPIAVKSEVAMAGLPETWGTRVREFMPIPEESVTPIKKLEAVGALASFFSTAMHEIGLGTSGFSSYISPLHATKGSPRNPFNRSHVTGGSSSGSAAAVGAGIVPLAISLDGGGSIRIPSGLCGAVGVKATYQRVDLPEEGMCWTVGHLGPTASTMDDARLMLEIISQQPNAQFPQPPLSFPEYKNIKNLKGIRVGVYRDWNNDASPVMREATRKAEEKLKKLGAEIVEIKIPNLRALFLSQVSTIATEMVTPMQRFGRKNQSKMEYETQISLRAFETLNARHYVSAQIVRRYFYDVVVKGIIFKKCDVLLTPNTADTAQVAAEEPYGMVNLEDTASRMRFMFLGNVVGIPGVAIPTGELEEGTNLPLAVQLYGDHWEEGKMMRVAKAIEIPDKILKPKLEKSYFEEL